jgi:hypothetical protein
MPSSSNPKLSLLIICVFNFTSSSVVQSSWPRFNQIPKVASVVWVTKQKWWKIISCCRVKTLYHSTRRVITQGIQPGAKASHEDDAFPICCSTTPKKSMNPGVIWCETDLFEHQEGGTGAAGMVVPFLSFYSCRSCQQITIASILSDLTNRLRKSATQRKKKVSDEMRSGRWRNHHKRL